MRVLVAIAVLGAFAYLGVQAAPAVMDSDEQTFRGWISGSANNQTFLPSDKGDVRLTSRGWRRLWGRMTRYRNRHTEEAVQSGTDLSDSELNCIFKQGRSFTDSGDSCQVQFLHAQQVGQSYITFSSAKIKDDDHQFYLLSTSSCTRDRVQTFQLVYSRVKIPLPSDAAGRNLLMVVYGDMANCNLEF